MTAWAGDVAWPGEVRRCCEWFGDALLQMRQTGGDETARRCPVAGRRARFNKPQGGWNQYRIGCACELLERTAMSVTEIALAVGYSDPAYFSRVFQRSEGCSPREYRSRREG